MIKKLRSIAVFATVVEQSGFRAAGRILGLAPSRVSQTVSDLETELGVTLLYRSTRRLSLTHEGEILYAKAKQMLDAAESGLDAIRPMSKEPDGTLRIAAPAFIAQSDVMDSLAEFAKAYPKINLDLDFSDRRRDLIKDGFDAAIRAGPLEDSQLLTRNLGATGRLLAASPEYYASKDKPSHPRDLERWEWVRFAVRPDRMELFSTKGEAASVVGTSHIVVDSVEALYEFVARGLGLSVLPENIAARGCARGDLVHVLPHWSPRPVELHVVWPDQSRRHNLTMIFVRFLSKKRLGKRTARRSLAHVS